jgi:hypothetical protein
VSGPSLDLDALADRIADRVADRIASRLLEAHDGAAPGAPLGAVLGGREELPALVDAKTVAAALGVTRSTVCEYADRLGARRLGDGPRPRLRFDLAEAVAAWSRGVAGGGSDEPSSPVNAGDPRPVGGREVERLPGLLPIFELNSPESEKSGPRDAATSGGRATRRTASPRREPTRRGSGSAAGGRALRAQPTEGGRDA